VRLCIVGNGPSASGKAAEIDACDFVVRTTGWWKNGPGDCGEKLSAYAWFGAMDQAAIPDRYAATAFEHWMTLPLSRCWPPQLTPDGQPHKGHWANLVEKATLRPIRWVTEFMWQREMACLTLLSKRGSPLCPPSTGFTAIDLAIRLYQPRELLLYGFDAIAKERPGWGDNNPEWQDDGPHDLGLEKQLIFRLMIDRVWINEPCGVQVVWPDCPTTEEV
jgi:hypothetical protein